ncbi:MAG: type II toxin-antitoxin system HicB family antitoxin [Actinomycetota bacterium]
MAEPREYEYVLEPQQDGGYLIYVPDLPDVATEGRTKEEAVSMLQDALAGYLETMRDRGWPLPEVERGKVAVS